jgi:hypothetical protein
MRTIPAKTVQNIQDGGHQTGSRLIFAVSVLNLRVTADVVHESR